MTLDQAIKIRTRHGPKPIFSSICSFCKKVFFSVSHQSNPQLRCSRNCAKRTGKFVSCSHCGKKIWRYPSQINKIRKPYCSKKCADIPGPNNPRWKKGEFIDPSNGYRMIRVNGKYVAEHRDVMEKHVGRKLQSDEIVHHLDKNKINNSISNLQIMSVAEHSKEHATHGDYFNHHK